MKIINNFKNENLFDNTNLNSFFDYLKINIASSKRIQFWAQKILPNGEIIGEILHSKTIDFKTNKPISNGLFCEKTFGPVTSYKCSCKKYKGSLLNKFCEICNVELTNSKIRKYRMGYINLTYPIVHKWFLKSVPNYLTILLKLFDLKITLSEIEKIIYSKNNIMYLNKSYFFLNNLFNKSNINFFYGNELIKIALDSINLDLEINKLRKLLNANLFSNIDINNQKIYIEQIRLLENFLITKIHPNSLILTTLPILPPSLRPFLKLENNKIVLTEINEFYRLIINRNLKLINIKYLKNLPLIIQIQERVALQEIIDLLINSDDLSETKNLYVNNNKIKSLTEILEGKFGHFRQYLLGKRVDFSARSIIIVNPQIRMNKCGLPYEILLELFMPFIIKELNKFNKLKKNNFLILDIINKRKPILWALINYFTKKYFILLNRAPTLHKYGIQSFNPFIVFDKAIHLHPLVCIGYNADFDGDQMAIYLPLYNSSQIELQYLMKSSTNLISSSNGFLIIKPTQEIIFGNFYLTLMLKNIKFNNKKIYNNENEALFSFYSKQINLHSSILIKYTLKNYKFKFRKNKLFLYNNLKLKLNIYKLKFLKIFYNNIYKKYYIITNIGILILLIIKKKYYIITNLIYETTPGRLIFNNNLKNLLF